MTRYVPSKGSVGKLSPTDPIFGVEHSFEVLGTPAKFQPHWTNFAMQSSSNLIVDRQGFWVIWGPYPPLIKVKLYVDTKQVLGISLEFSRNLLRIFPLEIFQNAKTDRIAFIVLINKYNIKWGLKSYVWKIYVLLIISKFNQIFPRHKSIFPCWNTNSDLRNGQVI